MSHLTVTKFAHVHTDFGTVDTESITDYSSLLPVELLPAGEICSASASRFARGGLDATRSSSPSWLPAAEALVTDPTVPVDANSSMRAGRGCGSSPTSRWATTTSTSTHAGDAGIAVTNTPDVLTNATAELALTLTLAAARRLTDAERDLRDGRWTAGPRAISVASS